MPVAIRAMSDLAFARPCASPTVPSICVVIPISSTMMPMTINISIRVKPPLLAERKGVKVWLSMFEKNV